MKSYLLVGCLAVMFCVLPAQKNISLLGHLSYPGGVSCSNLTAYVDSAGREYALVGTTEGLSIVAIDSPANPHELFLVPGATGNQGMWREVREYNGYAYVTTEQNSGLVVVNLNYLPDSVAYHTINPNGMHTSHTIFIDSTTGVAYVNGTDKGLLFLDVKNNPWNPTYLGKYTNNYVHDCYVRNDTLWAACINDGILKVIDVRNKSTADAAINNITQWATPLNFTHNCWLSDDRKFLFTTDEKPNSTLTCYDVSDLNNVTETDRTQVEPGSNTIIHNTYFRNNFCVTSYYTYGVAVFDVTRKNNLVEVGHFDTSPNFSGDGFNGQWGVWPYLPSGNIICSDIETGLWILKPEYKQAAYIEGTVKDSICQTFLTGVKVEIVGDSATDYTGFLGKFATGTVDTGTFTIRFSKSGYQTATISNVNLQPGLLYTYQVNLLPVSTSNLLVKTIDATSGNPLPNVMILITDTTGAVYQQVSSNSNGEYTFCDFVQGSYNFYAGKWGKVTAVANKAVSNGFDTLNITLANGYYDDFIFDFGWTVSSTASKGIWQRGAPVGTEYNVPDDCNPGTDINTDLGNDCYVTGNGGGNAGDDDIDNGYTILSSPPFDLTGYADAYISYYHWFFNDGGAGSAPNDSLHVYLTNGSDTALIGMCNADSVQSQWVYNNIRVSNFMFNSANMHLIFRAADDNPGHLVEAGVDKFTVIDSLTTTVEQKLSSKIQMQIFPNPFTNQFSIFLKNGDDSNYSIEVENTLGQMLIAKKLTNTYTSVTFGESISPGIYFAKLKYNNTTSQTVKLMKTN